MKTKNHVEGTLADYPTRRLGRVTWTRGYVTRRGRRLEDIPVVITTRGELYYLAPSWDSCQYCHRQYFTV